MLDEKRIDVQFSKNGSLPSFYLALACRSSQIWLGQINCLLSDVRATISALEECGIARRSGEYLDFNYSSVPCVWDSDLALFGTRYGILLAAFVSSFHEEFFIPDPGGCDFGGQRKIDYHLDVFRAGGIKAKPTKGGTQFKRPTRDGLQIPIEVSLPYPSVGATLQAMLFAVSQQSGARIVGNAREPEVDVLLRNARLLGAKVEQKANSIEIDATGIERGKVLRAENVRDRIEAGTLIAASVMARKPMVRICNVSEREIASVLDVVAGLGVRWHFSGGDLILSCDRIHTKCVNICAGPFPEFPTDLQPIFAAMLSTVPGEHFIKDAVFANRFDYVACFQKMGVRVARCVDGIRIVGGETRIRDVRIDLPNIRSTVACLLLAFLIGRGDPFLENRQVMRAHSSLFKKLHLIFD